MLQLLVWGYRTHSEGFVRRVEDFESGLIPQPHKSLRGGGGRVMVGILFKSTCRVCFQHKWYGVTGFNSGCCTRRSDFFPNTLNSLACGASGRGYDDRTVSSCFEKVPHWWFLALDTLGIHGDYGVVLVSQLFVLN